MRDEEVSASRGGILFDRPGGRQYENAVNNLVGFNVHIPAGCNHWDIPSINIYMEGGLEQGWMVGTILR